MERNEVEGKRKEWVARLNDAIERQVARAKALGVNPFESNSIWFDDEFRQALDDEERANVALEVLDRMVIRPLGKLGPKYSIGDHFYCSVAAPGCGHVIYEITSIENSGEAYGFIIEDTCRILESWEVM